MLWVLFGSGRMIGFFAEIFGRNCQGRAFRRWSSQSGGRGGHCRESWRQSYQCSCNDNSLATHFNENFEAIVKAVYSFFFTQFKMSQSQQSGFTQGCNKPTKNNEGRAIILEDFSH